MSSFQWEPMCFHDQGINDHMRDILHRTLENQQLFEGSKLLFDTTQLLIDSVLQSCKMLGNTQGLVTYFASTEGMLFLLILDKVALKQIHTEEDISMNTNIFLKVSLSLLHATEVLWNATGKVDCIPEDPALAKELCTDIKCCDHCGLWGVHWPDAFDKVVETPQSECVTGNVFYGEEFMLCVGMRLLSIVGQIFVKTRCSNSLAKNFEALGIILRILNLSAVPRHEDADILNADEKNNSPVSDLRNSFLRFLSCVAGVFIARTSGSIDGVSGIASKNVMPALAMLTDNTSRLPVVVRAELICVISGALWQSSRVSSSLVRRFRECGGYNFFLKCILTSGSTSNTARIKALWALCALLFVVPAPADADSARATAISLSASQHQIREAEEIACMQNYDSLIVLLKAFVQAHDEHFRADLLRMVQIVLVLQVCKSVEPVWKGRANLFITLFGKFDGLSLPSKQRILDMVDGSGVPFSALAQQELSCYCALLDQRHNRPSTILMIAKHLSTKLVNGGVQRQKLVNAELFPVLSAYVRAPLDIKCLAQLADPVEAAAVAQLLGMDPKDEKWHYYVACKISRRLLSLLRLLCTDCVQAMTMLVGGNEFAKLYELITIPEVRNAVLNLLAVAAGMFCRQNHGVIATMITILHPEGRESGLLTGGNNTVVMRTAILDALLKVLTSAKTQEAAISFRDGDGFGQALALIDSFRSRLPSSSPDAENDNASEPICPKECAHMHIQLMRVITAALKGHPENICYVRHKISLQHFAKAIMTCVEWCCYPSAQGSNDDQLDEFICVLFELAIRGSWPLNHALCKQCEDVMFSNDPGRLCPKCADITAIDIPEVLVIAVTSLLGAITAKGRTTVVTRILTDVLRLANASLSNIEALSAAHMQAHICAHYGWPALLEKAISEGIGGDTTNTMLLSLLHKLCIYDIPGSSSSSKHGNFLHELFSMAYKSSFNSAILTSAHMLLPSPGRSAPINYALFSRGTGLIGVSQKWRISPLSWPPTHFTASFWVCIHKCGVSATRTEGKQQAQHDNSRQRYNARDSQQIFILRADTIPSSESFSSPSAVSALQVAVRDDGALIMRVSPLMANTLSTAPKGITEVVFSKTHPLEDGLWHHIVLTYATERSKHSGLKLSTSNGSGRSRKYSTSSAGSLVDGNSGERTQSFLYVDGVQADSCTFSLPSATTIPGTVASVNAAVSGIGIITANAEQLCFAVGSDSSSQYSDIVGKTVGGKLRVSNTFLFADSVSSTEALAMHALGPAYDGNFRDLDAHNLRHSVASRIGMGGPQHFSLNKDERALLLSPSSISLHHLAQRMIAAFIARNLSIIIEENTEIPTVGIRFVPQEQAEDVMLPSSSRVLSTSFSSLLMPLSASSDSSSKFEEEETAENKSIALWELKLCTCRSRNIKSAINDVGGVAMLLYMLGIERTSEAQHLTFRLLTELLEGSAENSADFERADGYNILSRIMRCGEWHVDEETVTDVLAIVGLRDDGVNGAIADVEALKALAFDWEIWLRGSPHVRSRLFEALCAAITRNPNAELNIHQLLSLKPVTELLVVLWRPDTAGLVIAPLANLIRLLLRHSDGITKREIRYLSGLATAREPVGDAADFTIKQEHAVKIIAENVASGDITPSVRDIFMEELSLEINMNLLLDAPNCDTRILLISLLGSRLRSSAACSDFAKIGGFTLLALLLSKYPCDVPTLVALFRVLIGVNGDSNSAYSGRNAVSVHIAVTEMMNKEVAKLAHPEAFITIMSLVTGNEAPQELRISVVKAFQRICAASVDIVKSLLDCGFLLAVHNLHLAVLANRPENASEDSLDEDDDVFLGLYRDVVLSTSGNNLDAILMFYSADKLAETQLRIVQRIIDFFKENMQFCYVADLVPKYVHVVNIATRFVIATASPEISPVCVQACEHILTTLIGLNMSVLGLVSSDPKARDTVSDACTAQITDSEWRAIHHIIKAETATRARFYSTELLEMALEVATSEQILHHTLPDAPFVASCMAWILALCTAYLAPAEDHNADDGNDQKRYKMIEKARKTYATLRKHASYEQQDTAPSEAAVDPGLDVREKLYNFFGVVLPPEDTHEISQACVDKAINCDENEREQSIVAWEAQQARLAGALQGAAAMDKLASEQLRQRFTALHADNREPQEKHKDHRPDESFVFAQTKRLILDAQETHKMWRKLFKAYSHERGVLAVSLHAPFKRITIDSTQDSQHQRLRTRWKVSDPVELTLEAPYAIPIVARGEPGTSFVVEPLSGHYSFRLANWKDGVGKDQQSKGADASASQGGDKDPNIDASEVVSYEFLPFVTNVSPQWESGTLSGGGTVTLTGRNFHAEDKENIAAYVGGIRVPILNVASSTELTITVPQVREWGFYEVIVMYKGCFLKCSPAARYGYIEDDKFKRYLCDKNRILPNVKDAYVPPAVKGGINNCAKNKKDERTKGKTASDIEMELQIEKENAVNALLKSQLLTDPVVAKAKFSEKCTLVTMYSDRHGFIILTDDEICFYDTDYAKKTWKYTDVSEIHGRRHVLRDVAIELFFVTGKACLVAFAEKAERDRFWNTIRTMNLPNMHVYDTEDDLRTKILTDSITDRWIRGEISNYEYLMRLNTLAGRTFNDLNQYPVFPWVIADYTSKELNLNDPKTFRDLSKPMGAQTERSVERYRKVYTQLAEMGEIPYNYGSHYSNAAIVIYYLTRLEPYATFHIMFQSGRFDVPDRLFNSVSKTFEIAYGNPMGDVKELVPEFYCLPDFLDNSSDLDFGERQDGIRVHNAELPPWAKNDPREFIRINRAALESEYVSAHIHEWIDLVFGYKQQSREALNVFHPFTCEGGIDWDSITDPAERLAKQTQVNTWGQTPRKLFRKPHPPRNSKAIHSLFVEPMLGRQQCPISASAVLAIHAPVADIMFLPGNRPIAFPQSRIVTSTDRIMEFVEWGSWDNSLYAFPVLTDSQSFQYARGTAGGGPGALLTTPMATATTAQRALSKATRVVDTGDVLEVIASSPSGHCLASGTRSGTILVWKRPTPSSSIFTTKMEKLIGHTKAITALSVSSEYNIIASASDDCTCILWDISRLKYIETLKHNSPVGNVCISSVSGNIITVEKVPPYGKPLRMHLWNINGKHLAQVDTEAPITCLQMTSYPISIIPNAVVVGCVDGSIEIYNEDTLTMLMSIKTQESGDPITFIKISQDNRHVFTGDSSGNVVDWVFGEEIIELDL